MLHPRRSLHLAVAAALLAGCAHAGPAPTAQAPAAGPVQAAAPEAAEAPPAAVIVTGSRIPQRVDLSTGLPRTTSAVTVWTRQQLDGTGEAGVGDALKRLGP